MKYSQLTPCPNQTCSIIGMDGRKEIFSLNALVGYVWKAFQFHWRYDIETLSILVPLSDRNSPITNVFPSQKANDVELWCFLCCRSKQAYEQELKKYA